MRCANEVVELTEYMRGVILGDRGDVDVMKSRALESLRRQPLAVFLAKLTRSGCTIRGARGNSPRDIVELLDQVREQLGVSKQELARRSGVSRGHIIELFGPDEPRPILETIIRLAIGLDFPLEIVSQADDELDDGKVGTTSTGTSPAPGARVDELDDGKVRTTSTGTSPTTGVRVDDELADGKVRTTSAIDRPVAEGAVETQGSTWADSGAFGVSMTTATVVPQILGEHPAAYVGCGVLGVAAVGLAVFTNDPKLRRKAGLVGAGLLAGAGVGGMAALMRARRAAKRKEEEAHAG